MIYLLYVLPTLDRNDQQAIEKGLKFLKDSASQGITSVCDKINNILDNLYQILMKYFIFSLVYTGSVLSWAVLFETEKF